MTVSHRASIDEQVIREDALGVGIYKICYPGVSSCLTVTGLHANKLIGCHFTVYTRLDEINDIFSKMVTEGGDACSVLYVAGRTRSFKGTTKLNEFKTRKLMSQYMRSKICPEAKVKFFDTAAIPDADIFVERNGMKAEFSYRKGTLSSVSGFDYPVSPVTTSIKESDFQRR